MIAPLIALGYRREGEVSLLAFSLKQVRKAGLFFNEIHSSKLVINKWTFLFYFMPLSEVLLRLGFHSYRRI